MLIKEDVLETIIICQRLMLRIGALNIIDLNYNHTYLIE